MLFEKATIKMHILQITFLVGTSSVVDQYWIPEQKVVGLSSVVVNMLCSRLRYLTIITSLDPGV